MFLTTQRRWPLVCAIVGLYLIPSAVSAQSDLETLNQKIQAMEAREAASDRRIQELEARLADFEAGDHATSGRLETLINGVFETEGAQVSTPKSQMLKIGGQFRFRGEYRTTRDYSAGGVGNGADFVIQRTRLNFDFRVMENLRAFVELQDSRLWGEEPSVVGDLEGVDIHQAYVDFENAFHAPLTFRVGRQELSYGDQRLVSPLDWHPVGRTFDGVRAFYEEGDWQLDAFVANVREAHPAGERDDDLIFAGLYWHFMGLENHEIDAYLFYRSYANGAFVAENGVAGDLEDVTFGLRFKGSSGGFKYSVEAVGQFGDRSDDDVQAYAWALTFGYTFNHEWKPTIMLEWDFASGDDNPNDGDYETFDPLFPFGHAYQGFLDIFAWRNGHDLVFRFNVKPRGDWWLEAALHHFILDSDNDAWYNAGGAAMRRVGGGVSNTVGWELDIHAKHDLNDATKLWFGYSHFFPGNYVDQTGPDPATDWVYFQMTIAF